MLAVLSVTFHKAQEISDCEMLAALSETFHKAHEISDCAMFAVLTVTFHKAQEISDGLNMRCGSGYQQIFIIFQIF